MAVQKIICGRLRKLTDDEKIEPLRRLYRKHGYLSSRLIEQSPNTPSSHYYYYWFGGLTPASKLAGYTDSREYKPFQRPLRSSHKTSSNLSNEQLIEILRSLLKEHGYLSRSLIDQTRGIPAAGTYFNRFGSMARAYRLARSKTNVSL